MASSIKERPSQALITDSTFAKVTAPDVSSPGQGTSYSSLIELGALILTDVVIFKDRSYKYFCYRDCFEGRDIFYVASISPPAVGWGYSYIEAWDAWVEKFLCATTPNAIRKTSELASGIADLPPGELIKRVERSQLRGNEELLAVQALGELRDPFVVPTLLRLLQSQSEVVREASVYALENYDEAGVLDAIRYVAENDPSPAVRQAATEALG